MVLNLLTELGWAREKIFGSHTFCMDLAALVTYAKTSSQIFSHPAMTHSISNVTFWDHLEQ